MDVFSIVTVLYLVAIGSVFTTFGSNVQSRVFGLVTLLLAMGNALKLAGLI